MSEPIHNLLRFQEKDRIRAELARERAAAPAELEEAETRLAARRMVEERLGARIEATRAAHAQSEQDVETEKTRIRDRELKLRQVRTNEEFQAGMRELSEQRKRIGSLEDTVLARMEEIETLEGELTKASEARQAEESKIEEIRLELEARLEELDTKIEAARAEAATLEPEVPADLLALYRRVSEAIHDDPIVEVVSGTCRGCFMGVPHQLYNELHDPAVVHTCPSCHRILYVKVAADEASPA